MTVRELRRLLNTTPLLEDAQVLCWDADKGAWQPAKHDVGSVSGYSPFSSLLLGCSAHFEDWTEHAIRPLTERAGDVRQS